MELCFLDRLLKTVNGTTVQGTKPGTHVPAGRLLAQGYLWASVRMGELQASTLGCQADLPKIP